MNRYAKEYEERLLTLSSLKVLLTTGQLTRLKLLYEEPGRHYHTWDHVLDVLRAVLGLDIRSDARAALVLAALFHDAVYDISAPNGANETASIALMHEILAECDTKPFEPYLHQAEEAIIGTRHHASMMALLLPPLTKKFMDCDVLSIANPVWDLVRAQDYAIYREAEALFSDFGPEEQNVVREGRREFLRGWLNNAPTIFLDPELGKIHEWQARRNIARLLGHEHYEIR